MFSTSDDLGIRRVRAIVQGPKPYELEVPDAALEQWERRARVLPTNKVLHEYALTACEVAKRIDSQVTSVRAEYWENKINFSNLSVEATLHNIATVDPC